MAWVALDDTAPITRHHRALSDTANWTLICCLAYTNREATDGLIERGELAVVRPGMPAEQLAEAIAELEKAGAIAATESGWRVVWHMDRQPSAAEIVRRRQQATERQRRKRERDLQMSVTRDNRRDATRDVTRESRTPGPSRPGPSRPDPDLHPHHDQNGGGGGTAGASSPPALRAEDLERLWRAKGFNHRLQDWQDAYERAAAGVNELRDIDTEGGWTRIGIAKAWIDWIVDAPTGPMHRDRKPLRNPTPAHLAHGVQRDLQNVHEWLTAGSPRVGEIPPALRAESMAELIAREAAEARAKEAQCG